MSYRSFQDHRAELIASGLQVVEIAPGDNGKLNRYRAASLDRMIRQAAETDRPICKARTGMDAAGGAATS